MTVEFISPADLPSVSNQQAVFERIKALEDSTESWLKRSVVTVDLSQGRDSYIERMTLDLDVGCLKKYGFEGQYYIPVGWRARRTFLSYDCKSETGASLQLAKRAFREAYSEWLFFRYGRDLGILSDGAVPPCLVERVKRRIHDGCDLSAGHECCSGHPCDHELLWSALKKDERIKGFYDALGELEPIILIARQEEPPFLLKIAEQKANEKPRRRLIDVVLGRFVGTLKVRAATSTKFLAPRDMRFKSVIGLTSKAFRESDQTLSAEVFGDGAWAAATNGPVWENMSAWELTLAPRRSAFVSPAIRVLGLGLLACIYWLLTGFGVRDYNAILNSFSYLIVGSYYLHYLYLLDRKEVNSFLYGWSMRPQRHGLMIGMSIVGFFPVIPLFLKKACDFVVGLGVQGIDLVPVGVREHIYNISAMPYSEFVASDGVARVRIFLVALLTLVVVDLAMVQFASRPKYPTR